MESKDIMCIAAQATRVPAVKVLMDPMHMENRMYMVRVGMEENMADRSLDMLAVLD